MRKGALETPSVQSVDRVLTILEAVAKSKAPVPLAQLTDLYDASEPWCREVAQRTTDQVWAHDLSVVQAAAFARYARNATDYR